MTAEINLVVALASLALTFFVTMIALAFWLGTLSHRVTDITRRTGNLEAADNQDRAGSTSLQVSIAELRGQIAALTSLFGGAKAEFIASAFAQQGAAPQYQPQDLRRPGKP